MKRLKWRCETIKRRYDLGNACFNSIQNIFIFVSYLRMWRLKYIYKIQKGRHYSDLCTSTIIDLLCRNITIILPVLWLWSFEKWKGWECLKTGHCRDYMSYIIWNAWCSIYVFLHTKEWTSLSCFACSILEYLLCRLHQSDWEVLAVATDIIVHWFINVLLFLTPIFSVRQSF
jgi:hypothetical protein